MSLTVSACGGGGAAPSFRAADFAANFSGSRMREGAGRRVMAGPRSLPDHHGARGCRSAGSEVYFCASFLAQTKKER
jgi:hypothetical protein